MIIKTCNNDNSNVVSNSNDNSNDSSNDIIILMIIVTQIIVIVIRMEAERVAREQGGRLLLTDRQLETVERSR